MINRRSTFFLGIFILLIPFLGVPTSWKVTLTIFSGLALSLLSVTITLPKRTFRPRPKKEKFTSPINPVPALEREPIQEPQRYESLISEPTEVPAEEGVSKPVVVPKPRRRKPKIEKDLPQQSGNKAE